MHPAEPIHLVRDALAPLSLAQICSLLRFVCVLRFACCFAASCVREIVCFQRPFLLCMPGSWSSPRLLDCLLFLDLENLGISSFFRRAFD